MNTNYTDLRKKVIWRSKLLVYQFADFLLKEEDAEQKEQKTIAKIMKNAEKTGKIVCAIGCAENNIQCMHDCMKASNDIVNYLCNSENEVEEWQLAAINAMYDSCNTVIPYDLPYAIKGVLFMDQQCSNEKFKVGDVFTSTCIFTGGSLTKKIVMRNESKIVCSSIYEEMDGAHYVTDEYEICEDEFGEYIVLWEYHGEKGKLYAKDL